MFIFIFFSIFFFTYAYIGWRLIVPSKISVFGKKILWSILVLFAIIPPGSILMRMSNYGSVFYSWISFLSLGFFFVLFISLVIKDLILSVLIGVKRTAAFVRSLSFSEKKQSEVSNPGRRHFLAYSLNLGVLGISGILTGYGLYQARRRPDVVRIVVPIENLPKEFEGFRIVQITDMHIGLTISRGYVQPVVEIVNSLNPDIIAITGDLVDGSVKEIGDDVAPIKELSARLGSFFVTGNHDYYSGIEPWIEEIDR